MVVKQQRRVGRRDVFISSTTQDLQKHRQAAEDATYRADLYPHMMESMGASTADAIDFSLQMVDEAEIYVGIFGMRYGYIPNDIQRNPNSLSITELEYRRAVNNGIEILVFIMDDEHEILAKYAETEPEKLAKLMLLKNELKTRHVVGFFNSIDTLGNKIFQALQSKRIKEYLARLDAEAVKSGAANGTKESRQLIPVPPRPYHVHPYILPDEFVGRKSELAELDGWAASADTVLVIEALGGVGKSALTRQWVGHQEINGSPFVGTFWWSFYESNAVMDNFLHQLLLYITEQTVDIENMPRAERELLVLRLLREKSYLIIMDGIERILLAYQRLEGLHTVENTDERRLRSFADPRDDEFLNKLAACAPSKLLLSTRLVPQALRGRTLGLLRGVRYKYLKGLAPEDALQLMRSMGVYGDAESILRFTVQFDNHSLLLNVIGGRVASYRPAPGDFDSWYADEGRNLKLTDLNLEQRRTHILNNVLEDLSPELRKLLGQIAAFRYPIDYQTLSSINPFLRPRPAKAGEPEEARLKELQSALTKLKRVRNRAPEQNEQIATMSEQISALERKIPGQRERWEAYQQALRDYDKTADEAKGKLHAGLTALEERGLLQWDRQNNRYDLHAIVRAYVHEQMAADDMRHAYERMRDHFSELPPENTEQVQELSHLRGSLELYDVLVRLNRLEEAMEVYDKRLKNALQYKLAAYQTIVDLLLPLFPKDLSGLPRLENWRQQNICLTDMATSLYYLGRNADSVRLRDMKIKLSLDHERHQSLGVALRNYSSSLRLDQNKLATALRACLLALEVAEIANDGEGLAVSYFYLLGLYGDMGWWEDAQAAYEAFHRSVQTRPRILTKWQSAIERAYAETLLAKGDDASFALDNAAALAAKSATRNEVDIREISRLRGEIALMQGQPAIAADFFLDTMTFARKSGLSIAGLLGRLALARVQDNQPDEARQLIEDALAQAGEARLHDLLNSAAEVYSTLGDEQIARQYAEQAYQEAIADGVPYIWWKRLDRARVVLKSLGVKPPIVPRFSENKTDAIPYEEDILTYIQQLKRGEKTIGQEA